MRSICRPHGSLSNLNECDHLKVMFTNLKYPESLIESTVSHFVTSVRSENREVQAQTTNENDVHRVVLPHLTMMTWSHRNVVLNFFRSFLSLKKYLVGFSPCSTHLTLERRIAPFPLASYIR